MMDIFWGLNLKPLALNVLMINVPAVGYAYNRMNLCDLHNPSVVSHLNTLY